MVNMTHDGLQGLQQVGSQGRLAFLWVMQSHQLQSTFQFCWMIDGVRLQSQEAVGVLVACAR